ncbi:MAG: hypothetical protein ACYCUM_06105 [Solirubrobacteraceae bacterium]
MRLRLALGLALLGVLGVFVVVMSASASRLVSTNHVDPFGFVAVVRPGKKICQPGAVVPRDAASARVYVGTYGRPMPAISATVEQAGTAIAAGQLPAEAAPQGFVEVPLATPHPAASDGTLCLRFHTDHRVALAGAATAPGPGSEQIGGRAAGGALALALSGPRESWWSLLPALSERLAFGKAGFFGVWLLPLAAALLLLIWGATVRLLLRESS